MTLCRKGALGPPPPQPPPTTPRTCSRTHTPSCTRAPPPAPGRGAAGIPASRPVPRLRALPGPPAGRDSSAARAPRLLDSRLSPPLPAPPFPRPLRKGPDLRGGVGGGPPAPVASTSFLPGSPSPAGLSGLESSLRYLPLAQLHRFSSLLILGQPPGRFASPPSPNQIRFKTVARTGRPTEKSTNAQHTGGDSWLPAGAHAPYSRCFTVPT